MPKLISEAPSVAANARSVDQMANTSLQFAKFFARYLCAFNGAATGLRLTMIVGSEVVFDDIRLNDANRFPVNPDDYVYTTGVEPGDQVQVFLRNTTGAPIVCQFQIVSEPVAIG